MRLKQLPVLIAVVVALALCSFASGKQGTEDQTAATGKTITATGCLASGMSPDQFTLAGDDGQSYQLQSTNVPLAEHVGQKVTVSGTPASGAPPADKPGTQKSSARHSGSASLQVKDVQEVSPTCK